MKIKAQYAMVINLDKCIGCHTCSVTCKNTWTNRDGAEYMWWNNVETKPGTGYPRRWEDQNKHKGGWTLRHGQLQLKAGNRLARLAKIFYNPDLTPIDEYYEPWTYDYGKLLNSPARKHQPVARPHSVLTGQPMEIKWGPNWEDDLAGVHVTGREDVNLQGLEESIRFELEQAFMLHLPRLCEHCLNPACLAACPSGAIYKRDEDGVVLVDQEVCRGWRFCTSSCPYKKIYFNWKTSKAEKCILCYPRLEAGLPSVCAETCTGRLRYTGLILYDADAVPAAASAGEPQDLYRAHLRLLLDPFDPEVMAQARRDGIAEDWLMAAQRSPVYQLAVRWGLALPLHPEYRTLPMVWYIPPLSAFRHVAAGAEAHFRPTGENVAASGHYDNQIIFPSVDQLRIPIQYLANLLAAGDTGAVSTVLKKLLTVRSSMREISQGRTPAPEPLAALGLDAQTILDIYRLLAVAKYSDRHVIPPSHKERLGNPYRGQGTAGLDFAAACSACGQKEGANGG